MDNNNLTNLKIHYHQELKEYDLHHSISNIDEDADVVGFDFDHTFFSYNIHNLLEHIYIAFTKVLVHHKGYPKVLIFEEDHDQINRENMHKFACTEIVIDLLRGNLLKLDENRSPIIVYHGVDKLNYDEVKKIYGETVNVSFENSKTKEYYINFTNFENHYIPIFAFCVHLYDKNLLPQIDSYHRILEHILEATKFNYTLKDPLTSKYYKMEEVGYYFPEICKNTEKYVTKNIQYLEVLERLKKKGKHIFIVTNSTFEYTHALMKSIFGDVNLILIIERLQRLF